MSESAISVTTVAALPVTALAPVVITRPNDVTAYVAGDVYGAAADARVEIAGMTPSKKIAALRFYVVQSRPGSDAAVSIAWIPFISQPATVIGDNARLDLSDADIALAAAALGPHTASNPLPNIAQNNSNWLNGSAGIAGRRSAIFGLFITQGLTVPASGSIWLYPFLTAAYVPLALETITLFPYVAYLA